MAAMNLNFSPILACCIALCGCSKQETPKTAVAPAATSAGLEGMYVVVTFHRGALGMSRENSVPLGVDTLDGNSLTIGGFVHQQTDQFLVLGRFKERDKNEGLDWIPLTSVLKIGQPTNQDRNWKEPEDAPPGWRLERLQDLMSMVAFDLSELQEGRLEVWIARNGEKELMDSADTMPGREQWMYFGMAPASDGTLFMSVIGKEGNGGNLFFYHGENLKPFRKTIEPGHDWTKASVIAIEATGKGKIYAQLKPAK